MILAIFIRRDPCRLNVLLPQDAAGRPDGAPRLGLAYHNYAGENNNAFPPAYISDQTKPAGWGTFILPQIEQLPLYKAYNFSVPFYYTNLPFGIDPPAPPRVEPVREPLAWVATAESFVDKLVEASEGESLPILVAAEGAAGATYFILDLGRYADEHEFARGVRTFMSKVAA